MPVKILIADDDNDLVEGLRWYLEDEGFEVVTVDDGKSALTAFKKQKPDIVILDIMMPGIDGITVCETIRKESSVSILMLSAKDGEIDKVRALEKGADDYITKPFYVTELVARIKAILRRAEYGQTSSGSSFKWEGLEIFQDERRVTVNGQNVQLSTMEFDILTALTRRPKVVFSRQQIVDLVWSGNFVGELRLVDNHIYRLRDKLISAGLTDCPIVTIRGVGYAFRPED